MTFFFFHIYSRALVASDCSRKLGLDVAYQHILNIVTFLGHPINGKARPYVLDHWKFSFVDLCFEVSIIMIKNY